MNANLTKLFNIAQKPKRLIIGLMSGTSLDGLDIALCSFEGSGMDTKTTLLQFETVPYSDHLKEEIKTVFAKQMVSLEKLCLLNPWFALQHAEMILNCLKKWNINVKEIDLIASHGQTIYHAPKRLHQQENFGNATLQIGDGDHLAVATGIITISDFRQKHIAAGGEGAPLAAYGDRILFSKKGEDRILLNIGGIANLTFLPGDGDKTIFCSDLGPGNTMMDALVQQHFAGKYFDEDAAVAKKGTINDTLLAALKEHDFFDQPFPKTTGPELFNLDYLQQAKERSETTNISIEDTMATLNAFTADCIVKVIKQFKRNNAIVKVFSSGGGMHNPLLMQHLQQALPGFSFHTTAELNILPDAKEAVLFAVLANECVSGNNSFKKGTKDMPAAGMGKISFPS
jgi:anhydro-N-acetylmuramic acid kinase